MRSGYTIMFSAAHQYSLINCARRPRPNKLQIILYFDILLSCRSDLIPSVTNVRSSEDGHVLKKYGTPQKVPTKGSSYHPSALMKRSQTHPNDLRKRKTQRRGWHAETYHEPDSDDNLEEEAHHHTRATFSTSGSHASTSTLFMQGSQPRQPPSTTTFSDSTPSIEESESYFLSGDSLDWARYGIMDPEESTAWGEEHGLKERRARTASVRFFCIKIGWIFLLAFILG